MNIGYGRFASKDPYTELVERVYNAGGLTPGASELVRRKLESLPRPPQEVVHFARRRPTGRNAAEEAIIEGIRQRERRRLERGALGLRVNVQDAGSNNRDEDHPGTPVPEHDLGECTPRVCVPLKDVSWPRPETPRGDE